MNTSIGCIDQIFEKTLEGFQDYLHSQISIVDSEFAFPDQAIEGANRESVKLRVKILNASPTTEGSGEIVFVGVRLIVTCTGSDEMFHKLKQAIGFADNKSLQPHTIRQSGTPIDRTILWWGDTPVDEEDYSCRNSRTIDGATLFPGETTTYEIDLPIESLPFVSIDATGVILPGNLFQFSHSLGGLEEWSRTDFDRQYEALVQY